jgi:hypothetical protein
MTKHYVTRALPLTLSTVLGLAIACSTNAPAPNTSTAPGSTAATPTPRTVLTALTAAQVRAAWIAALRSGRYQQVSGAFVTRASNGAMAYCALSVLFDLAVQAQIVQPPTFDDDGKGQYPNQDIFTGPALAWAGMTPEQSEQVFLMNDQNGATFSQIADSIEGWH